MSSGGVNPSFPSNLGMPEDRPPPLGPPDLLGDDGQREITSGQTNIELLARGLRLLAITQLRQLLREYSIPTGGNKQSLVERLVMYLETFGPSQQDLLLQFSVKLKKLLSSGSPDEKEQYREESPAEMLPPEISEKLMATSPSCLFELTEQRLAFGPVMVQTKMPSDVFDFTLLTSESRCVPVLQVASLLPDSQLNSVTLQLAGRVFTLREPSLWVAIPEVVNKPTSLQITDVIPSSPIIVLIRWLAKLPVETLMEMIMRKDPRDLQDFPDAKNNGICPLTNKIISTPVRSVKCLHGDCVDLSGFLAVASTSNDWTCPICHKQILAEDLRVDSRYFLKTISPPV